MARSRSKNDVEYYRGLVQQLKAEVRNLKKQLGNSNKKVQTYQEHMSDHAEFEIEKEVSEKKPIPATPSNRCPQCQAKIEEVHIGVRILINCKACGFRLTKKIK